MTEQSTLNLPDHVPADLYRDWPAGNVLAGDWRNPFAETEAVFSADYPSIFYTMGNFGVYTWMVTRHEDVRTVYQTPEIFSSIGIGGYQKLAGEEWEMLPLAIDAPDHSNYRSLLLPPLSPKKISALEEPMRLRSLELIDSFISKGECDFVDDFARPYPISIFMNLMGFPSSMYEQFLQWEKCILSGGDLTLDDRASGIRDCIAWLRGFIEERENNPQQDLTTTIVTSQINGKPITPDGKIGMVFMLFVGGLDTVASSLSLWFTWLGVNTDYRQQLIDNPKLIPSAVEELLRVNPVVNSPRYVKEDTVFRGVTMKKGDQVTCMNSAACFDEAVFNCPREVVFDRAPNKHLTLAAGPHRCMGSHLARRELKIALETWLEKIPNYRIKPGSDVTAFGGLGGVKWLPLEWDI